jgi:hypothetical protein
MPPSRRGEADIARRLRVLVVEDDPSDVELVLRALKTGGIEADLWSLKLWSSYVYHKNNYAVVWRTTLRVEWAGTVEILRRRENDSVILVSGPGRGQGGQMHQAGGR